MTSQLVRQVTRRGHGVEETTLDDPAPPGDKGLAGGDKPVDESQMTYLMKEINRIMSRMNCNIAFEYHKDVDVMSVRMLEKKTGKLIKEMPPEYMIKGMEKTREWLGTFLDQPA